MLKNVPKIIPPELLKILCEMGHGDEIVVADGNFPSKSVGQRVVYMCGNGGCEVLKSVLELIPLDTYQKPLYLMAKTQGDNTPTPIWNEYKEITKQYTTDDFEYVERFAFYERAKKAYAVISTGERALYANILIKKGVITD